MSNRFKVLGGSLAGAFAIHVALVACGSVSPPSPPAGDGGLVDAVADALVDALQHAADAVVDAEVRDAHAGGDGGVPSDGGACSCAPARPEYSFTASVVRDGMTLRPVADFSRATITWGRGDAFGGPAEVNANISVSFYLPDGASIQLSQCDLRTDLAGAAMSRGLRCTGALYRSLDRAVDGELPSTGGSFIIEGARASVLSDERIEVSVPLATFNLVRGAMPAGTLQLRDLVVRGYMPGATNLTPPRAYRP
jgi:hypothetical protein